MLGIYNFVPPGFILPLDYDKFVQACEELVSAAFYFMQSSKLQQQCDPPTIWIAKPYDLSRGRGIFLLRGPNEIQQNAALVVQEYIQRPLLIDGLKLDLRLYVFVSSFAPLEIFIYKRGTQSSSA